MDCISENDAAFDSSRIRREAFYSLSVLTAVYVALHGLIALGIPFYEPATQCDDWVYTYPIQRLQEDGKFYLHPNTAALALPQIFCGWMVCLAAGGFSFGLLRTAMVVFGVVPIWLCWAFLRNSGLSSRSAVLASLPFLANPIVVIMTWSFQTDVVFVAGVLAALTTAMVYGRNPTCTRWLWLTLVALLLTCVTRQSGIFVSLAIGCFFTLRGRHKSAALVLATIPVTMLIERWFVAQSDLTYLVYAKQVLWSELTGHPILRLFLSGYEGLHLIALMGLLLLPVLLAGYQKPSSRSHVVLAVLMMGLMFWLDQGTGQTIFPGNFLEVLPEPSLGPRTLEISTDPMAAVGIQREGTWLLGLATILGIVGGGLLSLRMIEAVREIYRAVRTRVVEDRAAAQLAFFLVFGSIFLISTFIGRRPFDKYLLCVIPLAIPLCLHGRFTFRRLFVWMAPGAVALLALSYVGSVDYWSWNAARWQAIDWLESRGAVPNQIDGGYEYNGMHRTLVLPSGVRKSTQPGYDDSAAAIPAGSEFYALCLQPPQSDPSTEMLIHTVEYSVPWSTTPRKIFVTRRGPALQSQALSLSPASRQ